MNTIEKMREVADLLLSQRKYREAYTIYDELYKQLWSIFGTVQAGYTRYPNGFHEETNSSDYSFQKYSAEPIAYALCWRIYHINLSSALYEFVRIIFGRLQCICFSSEVREEIIPDAVLNEFLILYALVLQPAQQRKITPVLTMVTAIVDGGNRFRKIRSNYPRNVVEKLLVENANKNKDGEWKASNHLLLDYLFNIGKSKTDLYIRLSNIISSYSYHSYYKQYRSDWYKNNNRYERYENRTASSSRQFHPATATEEEKKAYYGKLIGLMGRVTKAQIRSKYINLVSLYHPDKVQHLGPELKELAEMKTKEINAAYDWLKSKYYI